jgi:hypothetical protein
MFADNGWPVIDVSRRSIEESAAAVINLYNERHNVRASTGADIEREPGGWRDAAIGSAQ